ncbi:MAG: glycosyltransferase [Armatimonadota bacterium]
MRIQAPEKGDTIPALSRAARARRRLKELFYGGAFLFRIPFVQVVVNAVLFRLSRSHSRGDAIRRGATLTKIGRLRAFARLADFEEGQGNRLLALAYRCRLARWSGDAAHISLPEAVALLANTPFAEVQTTLPYVSGDKNGSEAARDLADYLMARTTRDFAPDPSVQVFCTTHHRREHPRVSILVSLYDARGKLPLFTRMLAQLDLVRSREAEVIFIDSGSPERQISEEEQAALADAMDCTVLRTPVRETILAAWNRGLAHARGEYICCLGVDEMISETALGMLATLLDARPEIDWAIGDSAVLDLDANGKVRRVTGTYERAGMNPSIPILDLSYLTYVGALYRRSLHQRYGLYDASFLAAGDTEFMYRVLPFINVAHVPQRLGFYLNYPDSRMSDHPRGEIECQRTRYLFWTTGGLKYLLQRKSEEEIVDCLRAALGYRLLYQPIMMTNIDMAVRLAGWLREIDPSSGMYAELHDDLGKIIGYYRQLDGWDGRWRELLRFTRIPFRLRALEKRHAALLGCPVYYHIFNDARYHLQAFVWQLPEGTAF